MKTAVQQVECSDNSDPRWEAAAVFLEENRQQIFFLVVFYVVTIALFIERFMHYSFMAEHRDLRRIMGVGIAVTRGAASSLSFCYCLLLLTVCRCSIQPNTSAPCCAGT